MREAAIIRENEAGELKFGGWTGNRRAALNAQSLAVDFSHCSMKRVRLGKAKLKGANFSGALLHGADLAGAVLEGAKFDGAALIDVDLSQVRIDPAVLARCVLPPTAKIVGRAAELRERLAGAARWVDTGGAEGRPAILDGEDLRPLGEVFVGARLTALSAKITCALGVSFRGAQLQGANFDKADLREADFTGCDLRGASFRGANLSHAVFDRADVRSLALSNGARATDFTGAVRGGDALAGCIAA